MHGCDGNRCGDWHDAGAVGSTAAAVLSHHSRPCAPCCMGGACTARRCTVMPLSLQPSQPWLPNATKRMHSPAGWLAWAAAAAVVVVCLFTPGRPKCAADAPPPPPCSLPLQLTLTYNRTRQASITTELIEIISAENSRGVGVVEVSPAPSAAGAHRRRHCRPPLHPCRCHCPGRLSAPSSSKPTRVSCDGAQPAAQQPISKIRRHCRL